MKKKNDPPKSSGRKHGNSTTIWLTLVGVFLTTLSFLTQNTYEWVSSFFSDAAVAFLLLAPGEFFLRRLRRDFQAVEQTANTAQDTAKEVAKSLEEVRTLVLQNEQDAHHKEVDSYKSLESHFSCQKLYEAIHLATTNNLISNSGFRVHVPDTWLYCKFAVSTDSSQFSATIEDEASTQLDEPIKWIPDMSTEDFYSKLIKSIRKSGGDLGLPDNDPTRLIQKLSVVLSQAAEVRSRGYYDTIQNLLQERDGWYFTKDYIVSRDMPHYTVRKSQIAKDPDVWDNQLRDKPWNTAEDTIHHARKLYNI